MESKEEDELNPTIAKSVLKTNQTMIASMKRMCDALEAQNRMLKRVMLAKDEAEAEKKLAAGEEVATTKKRKGRPPASGTWQEYVKRYEDRACIEHYSSLDASEKNSIRLAAKKKDSQRQQPAKPPSESKSIA